jgi:hypothetical protein
MALAPVLRIAHARLLLALDLKLSAVEITASVVLLVTV